MERAGSATTRQLASSQDRQAGGQAGSTKSQAAVAARRQEKRQLSSRLLHFAGATNFAFRTALLTASEPQKRSMLEPRWRPVQVKVLTSVPSPVRAIQISHSFTFQSRERTDGRTDLWSSFRTFRGQKERWGGGGSALTGRGGGGLKKWWGEGQGATSPISLRFSDVISFDL